MGDGMVGCRNGCFWGALILHLFEEKCFIFQGFGQKSGRPKTAVPATTYPIPHLTPSDFGRPATSGGMLHLCDSMASVRCTPLPDTLLNLPETEPPPSAQPEKHLTCPSPRCALHRAVLKGTN